MAVSKPFNKAWIQTWSAKYVAAHAGPGSLEARLLNTDGPAARARGYYLPQGFEDIAGEWKNKNRNLPLLKRNTPLEVAEVTGLAFTAPIDLQHRVLTFLKGVAVPSATALLIFAFPDVHTVIDFRAVAALAQLYGTGKITRVPPAAGGGLPAYPPYRQFCASLAATHGVTLRDLDRALWKWNQQGMPQF